MPTPEVPKILVHGTLCLDRILRVPELPIGGYVEIHQETWGLGGEAANTAANLTRWGAPIRFVPNPIGTDELSEKLVKLATAMGIPVEAIARRPAARTPICEIYVTPDGERTMFGQGFAELATTPLEPFDTSGCGWFTTDSNFGDLGVEALRYATAQGLYTVAMDYAYKQPMPFADLHLTSADLFRQDPEEWVLRTGQTIVLTNGILGCELHGPAGSRNYPAFPAPQVVDTTGAGDCFRAGLLFGLQQGMPLGSALRFASAAAALSVGGLGACGGIPSLEAVLSHIEKHPEVASKFD